MKIYDLPRRSGKTTQCILELAKNPNAVLIVANRGKRRDIIEQYRGIEDIGRRVYTSYDIGDIKRHHGDIQNVDIVIDELDYVLSQLIGQRVKFVTLTTDKIATTERGEDS